MLEDTDVFVWDTVDNLVSEMGTGIDVNLVVGSSNIVKACGFFGLGGCCSCCNCEIWSWVDWGDVGNIAVDGFEIGCGYNEGKMTKCSLG